MPRVPTDEEVMRYMKQLNNWGRWGPDDQKGTVNYITAEKRKQAASLVREGISVTCSRIITQDASPDAVFGQPIRLMSGTGEAWVGKKSGPSTQGSSDFFGLFYHGYTVTHLDSLAHMFWDGKMYNGYPSDEVTGRDGAKKEDIEVLRDGIVTKGILLDVARAKGKKWMENGEGAFPEDLEEAERAQNVRVESGDVVFLRTGGLRRRNEEGAWDTAKLGYPGFHVASLPWLHERQAAIIGADMATEVQRSGYASLNSPIHQIAIPTMGLWLLDNANLEDLAAVCERLGRWEFMLVLAPIRVAGGTGCAINPIATF